MAALRSGHGCSVIKLGFILQESASSKLYKEDGDKIISRHKKGNPSDISRLGRRQEIFRTRVRKQRHQAKWELMKA